MSTGRSGAQRATHLRVGALALVFVGGTVGTAVRETLGLVVPRINDVPIAILGVNLVGAFVLGWLLESLLRRGNDQGRRQMVRLLLGTGVMGGFTTYSALAADTALLAVAGRGGVALSYGLATVLLGALATWCGIALAARRQPEGADT